MQRQQHMVDTCAFVAHRCACTELYVSFVALGPQIEMVLQGTAAGIINPIRHLTFRSFQKAIMSVQRLPSAAGLTPRPGMTPAEQPSAATSTGMTDGVPCDC